MIIYYYYNLVSKMYTKISFNRYAHYRSTIRHDDIIHRLPNLILIFSLWLHTTFQTGIFHCLIYTLFKLIMLIVGVPNILLYTQYLLHQHNTHVIR